MTSAVRPDLDPSDLLSLLTVTRPPHPYPSSLHPNTPYPLKQLHDTRYPPSHLARATATAVVAPVAIGSLKSLLDTFVAVEASEAISALAGHITTPASLAQFEGSEAAIDMLREAGAEEAAKLIARHLARNHPSTDERQSVRLLRRLRDLGMDDEIANAVDWLAENAVLTDPVHARVLLADLRHDGFLEAASRLADRAADQADLSHPGLAGKLLAELCMTGKEAGLLRRDPVGQATLWNLAAVARLARELAEAGALDSAIRLTDRVEPARASALLKEILERESLPGLIDAVARKAVAQVDLSRPAEVRTLLRRLSEAEASELIPELAALTCGHVDVSDPAIVSLVRMMRQVGEYNVAKVVARQAAADVGLTNAEAIADLIQETMDLGLTVEASRLAEHAVETTQGELPDLINLLSAMDEAGASDARTALAVKAAAAIDLSIDRPELTQLLDVLHDTGQDSVIGGMLRDLLGRDGAPGARIVSFVLEHSHRLGLDVLRAEIEGDVLPLVSLADPAAAASLLRELRRADVPAAGVADRAALEALVDRRGTAALLAEMRESGLTTAVEILAGRIKDEGDPDHPELELVMAELKQLGADATIDVIVDRAMKTAKRHGLAGRVDLLRTLGGLGYPSDAIETLARDTPLSISFSDRAGQDLEYVWLAVHEIPSPVSNDHAPPRCFAWSGGFTGPLAPMT